MAESFPKNQRGASGFLFHVFPGMRMAQKSSPAAATPEEVLLQSGNKLHFNHLPHQNPIMLWVNELLQLIPGLL